MSLPRTTIPEMCGSRQGEHCILGNVVLLIPPPRREGHAGNRSFN